ncbi:ATPase [Ralstonia nicotianae]|uniref:ATPase n=1 Tax=Ralstonia pseudosolanacearum TaxID=1310165 RepID=UPI00399D7590
MDNTTELADDAVTADTAGDTVTDDAVAESTDAFEHGAYPAPASAAAASTEPGSSAVAYQGELESELLEMERATETLQKAGLLSDAEASSQKGEVERTRKLFRELSPEDRATIVRRRRELGLQILHRQLAGASVVAVSVKLNHTRLRPLFEQWWPFMNRMSINLQRFGHSTFSPSELDKIIKHFEDEIARVEAYVDEVLRVAQAYRDAQEAEMEAQDKAIFKPSITLPSLAMDVEAYSPFSIRALGVLKRFDQAMDHFDFMVWNGIRDQSDINEEITRFLRKFQPLGIRCYTTHLRLMSTVRKI